MSQGKIDEELWAEAKRLSMTISEAHTYYLNAYIKKHKTFKPPKFKMELCRCCNGMGMVKESVKKQDDRRNTLHGERW